MKVDYESLAKALLFKYAGRNWAVVGDGTVAWAKRNIRLHIERDGDLMRLRAVAPELSASLPATGKEEDRG